jgi:hypothetical protein
MWNCKNCTKGFEREDHLIRHMNRKTHCYNELACQRCFKSFTKISDLKRHIGKKIPCYDKKGEMILELKIEETKLKQKEIDLKIVKASQPQTAGRDINNTNIETQNNITINNYHHEYNRPRQFIEDMIVSNDLIQTIQNLFKNQYNNSKYKENQCIKIKDNKIFALLKTDDGFKELGYAEIKPHIKQHIKTQVDDILQEHSELSDDDMISFNIAQKDFIERGKIQTVKKIPSYVNNERNNGIVKSQLKLALY